MLPVCGFSVYDSVETGPLRKSESQARLLQFCEHLTMFSIAKLRLLYLTRDKTKVKPRVKFQNLS